MRGLLLSAMLVFSGLCFADVPAIYYDGRPLDIPVKTGRVTELIFPQDVAKIVKGGGADSVLVEVMGPSVFLLPKDNNPADIFVTSVKGESYPLNLMIGATHEAKLKVAYAFDPNRLTDNSRSDVMDLMKLLIQGRVPAGATLLQGEGKKLLSEGRVELTLRTVFELPGLNGLVLSARNLTDNTVILPLQAIRYPRLLAISSDADSLSAKNNKGDTTVIYMVTGR